MDVLRVTVAFEDESQGYPISPRKVPLALLNRLTSEFAAFIKAGDEVDTKTVDVSVENGSLAFSTAPVYAPALAADIQALAQGTNLSRVHPERRKLLERWQIDARKGFGRRFKISTDRGTPAVVIDASTFFRAEDEETWVTVERYVHGELMDLGGSTSSNAHIRLPDGKMLVVRTDKELVRSEKQNLVYHKVHVRIRAEYNLETGDLRNPALIEFVEYSPTFDPAAHARLTEVGQRAWGDLDDPAEWIRNLRGSDS